MNVWRAACVGGRPVSRARALGHPVGLMRQGAAPGVRGRAFPRGVLHGDLANTLVRNGMWWAGRASDAGVSRAL